MKSTKWFRGKTGAADLENKTVVGYTQEETEKVAVLQCQKWMSVLLELPYERIKILGPQNQVVVHVLVKNSRLQITNILLLLCPIINIGMRCVLGACGQSAVEIGYLEVRPKRRKCNF